MKVTLNPPQIYVSAAEQKEHAHAKCGLRNLSKM